MQVLRGPDVPIHALSGGLVALLGYGNQGRAHALNLRDCGIRVRVGGRTGSAAMARASAEGFETANGPACIEEATLVVVALPDEVHQSVWNAWLRDALRPGQVVGFLHGLSVHFGLVAVPAGVGCVLVAPKGPGTTLRERFVEGTGIPALMAVHQEATHAGHARALALAWAAGLGCGRAGVVVTSFKDEAETDLFGEQAVLCGGMLALAHAAYDALVARGYPPMLAYLECVHEIKQVADLLYSRGPAGMCRAISNTAEFGAYEAAERIAGPDLRAHFSALLEAIQSGAFARRLSADAAAGSPWLRSQRERAAHSGWESAGREVRDLMPWLRPADEGSA